MKNRFPLVALLALASSSVLAQAPAANIAQRESNQETRIQNGLADGSLTVHEAGRLTREQARIDDLQARALRDGTLTDAERARLGAAQARASADIAAQRHDAQTGHPVSASSKRLQADLARSAHQRERIENGVRSGALTAHEAALLERGQANVARKQARASADGHVGAREQASIQRAQDRQSQRIYGQKHDRQRRG